MKKMKIGALLLTTLAICGCNNKGTQTNETVDVSNNMGMYFATLPAASCPGINTYLTLNADSTAYLTQLYLDSDNTSETVAGKWTFADSIFTVTTADGETKCYKLVSTDQIALVGQEKLVKKENILLKKAQMLPEDFVGTYHYSSDPEEKDAFKQTLTITKAGENSVEVTIATTGGAKQEQNIKAIGKVINNQIDVDLKNVLPDKMTSVMTIVPKDGGKEMFVFTSKFDDRYDLMYFCSGGGTLAGSYFKE